MPGFLFYIMKKIYLFLILLLSLTGVAQNTSMTTRPIECPELPYERMPGDPYLWDDLDTKPEFTGGYKAFTNLIMVGIDISDNNAPKGLSQRCYLSFIVEADGTLSNYIIRNDPGYGIGDEIVNAAKKITLRWTPGTVKNNPVRAGYAIALKITVP